MDIHVVQPGDTLYQLARQYGVSMDQLLRDNQLPNPAQLVVGQTIVVRYPETVHRVKEGDTLWSIARMHQISVRQLLRNNPGLEGRDRLFPGQTLVVSFRHTPELPLSVNGYAYPSIDRALLEGTLPDLSRLTPFTYRFEEDSLVPLRDESLVRAALQMGTAPIFHLSNLDSQERFSPELAQELLEDREDQEELIEEIIETVGEKGYRGVDVDFEFVPGQDAERYAQFLDRLRRALSPRGLSLTAAVAPKTSDSQPGRAQEGHDYVKIAQAVDYAVLMTYDWGWTGGPPMAVAPLPQVRQVVDYALTRFRPEQLYLGVPLYGYNWTLPWRDGSRAVSLGCQQAVRLAWDQRAAIRYDETAQAPWLRYFQDGVEHEVWFEDARSIQAKLNLALEYGLHGVSYWNVDRPFPQNWTVLNATAQVREEM